MQPNMYSGLAESPFQGFGPVRTPIQCEGIERGHRRIAEIGVSGSVNPQVNWGNVGSWALKNAPDILSTIGSFF